MERAGFDRQEKAVNFLCIISGFSDEDRAAAAAGIAAITAVILPGFTV